jgi:predicted metal-binding membrane protein
MMELWDKGMVTAIARRNISGGAADCGMLAVGLAAWLALYCAPQAIGDVICRSAGGSTTEPLGLAQAIVSWLVMMTAMAAPSLLLSRGLVRLSGKAASQPVSMLLATAITGAVAEWLMRPVGLVDSDGRFAAPLFAPAMFAAAVLMLVRSRNGQGREVLCRAACCASMVLLQFAGGVSNMIWMAVISGWMVLESLVPWRREFAVLGGLTLGLAASFSLLQGSS